MCADCRLSPSRNVLRVQPTVSSMEFTYSHVMLTRWEGAGQHRSISGVKRQQQEKEKKLKEGNATVRGIPLMAL